LTSTSKSSWQFEVSNFTFNENNRNIHNLIEHSNTVVFQLGLNGIGLPQTIFELLSKELFSLKQKISCSNGLGGICIADTLCEQVLPELKDHNLRFMF